ncbi:hypothetical protein L3Y34_006708 [Caenorhabditis briggsae]|uniref:Uncharacterized protein n=2 Tax=Caenorhabditis briggsae TaxID=6238 RepID=A0AAE8ZYE9_CAEBR|nr:hypothetical protein L3Y34_006708 [Caenorhabditis briggsae]
MSQQSKKNAEHMEWEQQEGDGGNNRGSKGIVEEGGKWGDGLEPEEQDVLEAAEKSRKSAATLGDGNSTQVSLRERKKLVLAFAEFVGSGEKLMEDMREQIYRYTNLTARVRDVVLKPVQQFVEQLAKRHRELDSGKWERIVMRMMRDHGIENFSELQAAISGAGRKERVADEEVEKSDNEWKFLQENWERQNDELRQRLEKARAEAEDLQLQLDAVQIEKEGCEKEMERLERAWKLERKTAKELRQMMEQSTGALQEARNTIGRFERIIECMARAREPKERRPAQNAIEAIDMERDSDESREMEYPG